MDGILIVKKEKGCTSHDVGSSSTRAKNGYSRWRRKSN